MWRKSRVKKSRVKKKSYEEKSCEEKSCEENLVRRKSKMDFLHTRLSKLMIFEDFLKIFQFRVKKTTIREMNYKRIILIIIYSWTMKIFTRDFSFLQFFEMLDFLELLGYSNQSRPLRDVTYRIVTVIYWYTLSFSLCIQSIDLHYYSR